MDEATYNKRMGIKIPRSTLLPPYLEINDYYTDYTDAMDAVMGPTVDDKIKVIQNIRNMWVQNPVTEVSAQNQTLITDDEWSHPERAILVQQANMLGMKLQNAGVVSDDAYQTIARFVGLYWFGKGTYAFIQFINYCLQSDLQVFNMWTTDYQTFYNEGDSHIGTPIWEGGTWYPTTHVTIEANGGLNGLDIFTLQSFFYEIANYNLVLKAIDASFDMTIVGNAGEDKSYLVAVGIYGVNEIVIANFKNRAAPPPSQIIVAEKLPTTYYAMGSVPVDFDTGVMLAEPSGWVYLDDGISRVPVYSKGAQTITNEADIGITLLGNKIPSNEFNLLYGPFSWIPFPGSSRSTSRIPVFSTNNYSIIDGIDVEARVVGTNRTQLLVNPTGFYEIQSGMWVPYWQ